MTTVKTTMPDSRKDYSPRLPPAHAGGPALPSLPLVCLALAPTEQLLLWTHSIDANTEDREVNSEGPSAGK